MLFEEKRMTLDADFGSEAHLTWQVVHERRYILPNHRDPADRFLAATAIAFDLILVTAD